MSLHIVKFFSRPLSIISAALLIHVGGAVAADSAGDAQQQARNCWLGESQPSRRHHPSGALTGQCGPPVMRRSKQGDYC